jgi:acyl-CoA thioesterase FadM
VTEVPTYEEVHDLPPLHVDLVGPEMIDRNGHMNVLFYIRLGGQAITVLWDDVLGAGYVERTRHGFFTLQHHVAYLAELTEGDALSIRVRVVGRSSRAIHLVVLVVDEDRRRVASVQEALMVHVDLETRASVPIPTSAGARLDATVAEHARLPWPPPTAGCTALRSPA